MCPACRTRYRTYGITKRAKWRAEREAFDKELIGLRTQEDERRQQAGQVVRLPLPVFVLLNSKKIDLVLDNNCSL
jgi:hypothetical protein